MTWNFRGLTTENLLTRHIGAQHSPLRGAPVQTNVRRVLPKSRQTNEIARYFRHEAANDPAVADLYRGEAAFNDIVGKITLLDRRFESVGGMYFHLGSNPTDTAQNFAETQMAYRLTGVRPSLPGQVAHYLDQIGLSKQEPHYKAAALVAARGEVEHPSRPEYHDAYHSSDVIAAMMAFLKKNNVLAVQGVPGAVPLSRQEIAVGIIAAAGHDVGHPGGKNALPGETVARDPFRLERNSVEIIEPLLDAAGLPPDSIARIRVAILSTSPDCNGPAKMLKEINRLHSSGEQIEWQKLPDHEKFSELQLLAEDPVVRVLAQNLGCADLAQSAMFGLTSNEIATHALQMEWRKRGYHDKLIGDLTAADGHLIPDGQTLKARKAFLDFGAYGEGGPNAAGAKAAVGRNYADLYSDTKAKLESLERV